MQVIDAKGKFFGTFNLFDLVVFLLIILAVITAGKLLFFNEALRILVSKPVPLPTCPQIEIPNINMMYTNVTVTLLMKDQPSWVVNAIPSDYNWFKEGFNLELLNKDILSKKDIPKNDISSKLYDLKLKFKLQTFKKEQYFIYEDNMLKIGNELSLQTPLIDITGTIIAIDVNE